MSDSGNFHDQEEESETAVNTAKRRGRGRKRTPSKFTSKSKKSKQNNGESKDVLVTPPYTVAQPPHTVPQLPQIVTNPSLPASQQANLLPHLMHITPQHAKTVPQHSQADPQPSNVVSEHLRTALGIPPSETPGARPQPPYPVHTHINAVTQPQLLSTVPQPQHTVPQHLTTGLLSPPTVPQPLESGLQTPNTVPQHLQTRLQSPQILTQHSNTVPQPVVHQAPCAVPQHSQVPHLSPAHGSIEGVTPLPTFFQFTLPSNLYTSPVINSALQTPLQQGVPSALTAPHSSTMSMLSALQDDKLSLILPVLVRMEHKIDQIMAIIGAKSSVGINGLQTENKYNPNLIDNQCESGPNSVMTGNGSIESKTESHSTTVTMVNQLNTDNLANHSNIPLPGKQKKCFTNGDEAVSAPIKSQSKESQSTASTTNYKRSNVNLTESHSSDGAMENSDTDTAMESISVEASSLTSSCNVTNLHPGLSTAQGRLIQRKMAKITELTLPENSNFPISRDNIIAMQAKSTSTMNFAVRLMRELFTLEELDGKNISGARGKDRVDPNRVEIIKEIVFQVYRTLPSDRDMVWRCCRKAMDSFMRRMKRERTLKSKTNSAATI